MECYSADYIFPTKDFVVLGNTATTEEIIHFLVPWLRLCSIGTIALWWRKSAGMACFGVLLMALGLMIPW